MQNARRNSMKSFGVQRSWRHSKWNLLLFIHFHLYINEEYNSKFWRCRKRLGGAGRSTHEWLLEKYFWNWSSMFGKGKIRLMGWTKKFDGCRKKHTAICCWKLFWVNLKPFGTTFCGYFFVHSAVLWWCLVSKPGG